MTIAARIMTARQLAALKAGARRYELVQGKLRMMSPAGGNHGMIALRVGRLLGAHVDEHALGAVFAAETGFLLDRDPDTVRAPDVAFVRRERLLQLEDLDGYLPLAPDVAIEVVSPGDSSSDVEAKAEMWLRYGVRMVLVVDPTNQSIRDYRSASMIQVLHLGDELDASDVVPGWTLKVSDAFPAAAR